MIRETLLKAGRLGRGARYTRSIGNRGTDREKKGEKGGGGNSGIDTAKRECNHAWWIGERAYVCVYVQAPIRPAKIANCISSFIHTLRPRDRFSALQNRV